MAVVAAAVVATAATSVVAIASEESAIFTRSNKLAEHPQKRLVRLEHIKPHLPGLRTGCAAHGGDAPLGAARDWVHAAAAARGSHRRGIPAAAAARRVPALAQ